jgi:Cysteine sulfinate desulfinase/cysteine desulfurase and related enzymes
MYKFVYLDHAATTSLKEEVLKEMTPYFYSNYGNPSSIYLLGRQNKIEIENSRKKVALALNCQPEEIFFTSGGTEADNWAIKGIAYANKNKGNHIIVSSIEHPAIKKCCEYLATQGFEITYLPVDEFGTVSIDELISSIKRETILISIMFANNEVGTIQPIKRIGKIAKERNIYFHTDAVQAVGNINIDVDEYNIDLLSLSAHKFYGPKGIGVLFVKNGTNIFQLLHGGSQEYGLRAGTENVAGIVGLGKAIEISNNNLNINIKKITNLRNKFIAGVEKNIDDVYLNGHPFDRLPGNANFFFANVNAKFLTSVLDQKGIFVSTGSACNCKSDNASSVLLSMNKSKDIALNSIRFSFGEENTSEEIDYVIKILSYEINNNRAIIND